MLKSRYPETPNRVSERQSKPSQRCVRLRSRGLGIRVEDAAFSDLIPQSKPRWQGTNFEAADELRGRSNSSRRAGF